MAAKDAAAETLRKSLADAKAELARSQPGTARASDEVADAADPDTGARSTLSFLGFSPSAAEKAEAAAA